MNNVLFVLNVCRYYYTRSLFRNNSYLDHKCSVKFGCGARGQNLELIKMYFLFFSLQPCSEIVHTLTMGTL